MAQIRNAKPNTAKRGEYQQHENTLSSTETGHILPNSFPIEVLDKVELRLISGLYQFCTIEYTSCPCFFPSGMCNVQLVALAQVFIKARGACLKR